MLPWATETAERSGPPKLTLSDSIMSSYDALPRSQSRRLQNDFLVRFHRPRFDRVSRRLVSNEILKTFIMIWSTKSLLIVSAGLRGDIRFRNVSPQSNRSPTGMFGGVFFCFFKDSLPSLRGEEWAAAAGNSTRREKG